MRLRVGFIGGNSNEIGSHSERIKCFNAWADKINMGSIDLSVLDGIRELADGDSEFLSTLIQLFLNSAPVKVQKMKEALGHNDAKTASFEAHSLKSSAASLGAMAVSRLAAEIEKGTKGGQVSVEIVDKFVEFEKEFSLALKELQGHLSAASIPTKKSA
jgi:HPt (histidine-containing phosphotransfer) domain-containing protein